MTTYPPPWQRGYPTDRPIVKASDPLGKAVGDLLMARYPERFDGESWDIWCKRRRPFMIQRQRVMRALASGDIPRAFRQLHRLGLYEQCLSAAALVDPLVAALVPQINGKHPEAHLEDNKP